MPNRLNGTELSAEEFRDNLRIRYNLEPLVMPDRCDGCGCKMSVEHALQCKVGGLVHIRHNDVAEEWGALNAQAFSPSAVSHEPRINSSETQEEAKDRTAEAAPTAPPAASQTAGRQ